MTAPQNHDSPMMPEDSLQDPELSFGDEGELTLLPAAAPVVRDVPVQIPEPEPVQLEEDANVPLDVEPDGEPEIGTAGAFESAAEAVQAVDVETAQPEAEADLGDDFPAPPADTAAEDELARLRVQLKAAQAELASAVQQRDAAADRNRALEQQLATAAPAGEVSRLQASLLEDRTARNQAEAQLAETRAELERLRAAPPVHAAPEADPARRLDMMEAQLNALQAENTQLRAALTDSQQAEARAEHALDDVSRRLSAEQQQKRDADASEAEGRTQLEQLRAAHEALSRELALARKELADGTEAAAQVDQRQREQGDRDAELRTVTEALAKAKAEVERLAPLAAEAERVAGLEDRITRLQEGLVAKEKEAAEVQEKLDTEAARSYRLAQRRIPALNKEIEESREAVRELERKLQKAELRAQTLVDQGRELKDKLAEMERALVGAKTRANDTAIIAPPGAESGALSQDETRRLANRLRETEEERAALARRMGELDALHGAELQRHSRRADELEKESEERLEQLLAARKQARALRERVANLARLAEELAGARDTQKVSVLKSLRDLATLPPEPPAPGA